MFCKMFHVEHFTGSSIFSALYLGRVLFGWLLRRSRWLLHREAVTAYGDAHNVL